MRVAFELTTLRPVPLVTPQVKIAPLSLAETLERCSVAACVPEKTVPEPLEP